MKKKKYKGEQQTKDDKMKENAKQIKWNRSKDHCWHLIVLCLLLLMIIFFFSPLTCLHFFFQNHLFIYFHERPSCRSILAPLMRLWWLNEKLRDACASIWTIFIAMARKEEFFYIFYFSFSWSLITTNVIVFTYAIFSPFILIIFVNFMIFIIALHRWCFIFLLLRDYFHHCCKYFSFSLILS